jgi:SAM-dependent methyltransferase
MKRFRRGFPKGDPDLVLPQAHYERFYAEELHKRTGMWRPWNKQPGKFLNYAAMLLTTGPVLDIGCGAGHLAAMYNAFGRRTEYAQGIEYCPSAIRIAQEKQAPWADFVLANAETHPALLKGNHYQTAVLLEVLEHIYEDQRLVSLIPKGRHVVASVPSFPTDGHCRWFANVNQARDRYRSLLRLSRIVVEAGVASDNRWFILHGVRI